MRLWRRVAAFSVAAICAAVLPGTAGAAEPRITARLSDGPQRWSDPSTWGGRVPGAGDVVTIPGGTKVLLDTSTPNLGGLYVNGTLTFARKDLELSSAYVMVHGLLRIGTRKAPFTDDATITLTGSDKTQNIMDMGTKVLGVMGGTLEFHGRRIAGWTRLASTADAGARRITIEKPLKWRVGDRIAIASSSYWRSHDEERTITTIDGTTIEFDEPLRYQHWGELQTIAGQTVDERAEVALLTRNVVVRGNNSTDGFGGHSMIMGGGAARIEGVEFQNMGQHNRLRRYPVHFHMDGAAPTSYLRKSSIHHSSNRCVTVHGTNELRVMGNVCFDHVGHGFFMEDGAEHDNVFADNLGFGTRENEDGLLPSDRSPATFWITNPDNAFRNNVAAGSDGFGFWYALPEHPTGLSTGASNIWPRRTPLKLFTGNVAHSNGDRGLNVDDGPGPDGNTTSTNYRPVVDPTDDDSEPVVARFDKLTAYMNRDRGVWLRGSHHVVSNAVLADNRAGATFASDESFLEDSLVVGETANKGTTESWEDAGINGHALPFFWEPEAQIAGFEFYDGRVGVSRTTFANFNGNSQRPSGALSYLHEDAFSIHPKNFAEGISFVNATPVYMSDPAEGYDGDAAKVFVDRDGSVTGTPDRAVVVNNPFLVDDGCQFRPIWNTYVCNLDYVALMVGSDAGPNAIKPVTLRREDGVVQTLVGCCDDSDDAWTSVISNRSYHVTFNGGTPRRARFVWRGGRARWVIVSMNVASAPEVSRWGYDLPPKSSLDALASSTDSAYFYNSNTNVVHVRMSSRYDWEEVVVRTP
ncbi:MAG: G8 domain-containing protein [Actinomycetota bacterium]